MTYIPEQTIYDFSISCELQNLLKEGQKILTNDGCTVIGFKDKSQAEKLSSILFDIGA